MKYRKEPYIKQRQNSDGRWTFQVYIRSDVGDITKSFSEKEYGSSKLAFDTAVKFKNQTLTDIANKTLFKANNITVKDCFEKYLETTTDSYATKQRHESLFKNYVTIKDKKIQELTRADIVAQLNSLVENQTDDTIMRIYSIWKNDIIDVALMNEYIGKNVMLGVKKPKSHVVHIKKDSNTSRKDVLLVEDLVLKRVINKYNANIIVYLIELLYYTGMRPSEALALTRDDVKDNYITVVKRLGSNLTEDNVITHCKTQQSVRNIPISSMLKQVLEDLLDYSKYNELFKKEDGEYMNSTWVGNIIRYLLRNYRKETNSTIHFNLYRLRHNLATELVTANVDSRTTMDILGHASYSMSVYYANSNDDKKKEALQLLN